MLALTFDIGPVRWLACKAAGLLTPRAYCSAMSGLRLCDVPVPELPGPDWVRLRTRLGGICGTDLAVVFLRHHPATILRSFSSFPAVLGHENVAVVEKPGSAAVEWDVGQRVCVEPSLSCVPRGIAPPCPPCREGLFCLCQNVLTGPIPPGTMIGANRLTGGSWGPFFIAHKSQLHAVPDGLSDEQAVLVDPLAGALHGVLRRPPAPGERVLVLGGGIIGIAVVASIRALECSCHITAVVRHAHQEALIRARGADTVLRWPRGLTQAHRYDRIADQVGGRRVSALFGNQMLLGGFDLVYDCIGTGRSLTDAMKFTRPRGTVVEMGTSQISVVDTTPLWFSEITLRGSYGRQMERTGGTVRHTYQHVFEMLQAGRLRTDGLLTHTFALREYRAAFHALAHRSAGSAVKVAFRHSGD